MSQSLIGRENWLNFTFYINHLNDFLNSRQHERGAVPQNPRVKA